MDRTIDLSNFIMGNSDKLPENVKSKLLKKLKEYDRPWVEF